MIYIHIPTHSSTKNKTRCTKKSLCIFVSGKDNKFTTKRKLLLLTATYVVIINIVITLESSKMVGSREADTTRLMEWIPQNRKKRGRSKKARREVKMA